MYTLTTNITQTIAPFPIDLTRDYARHNNTGEKIELRIKEGITFRFDPTKIPGGFHLRLKFWDENNIEYDSEIKNGEPISFLKHPLKDQPISSKIISASVCCC